MRSELVRTLAVVVVAICCSVPLSAQAQKQESGDVAGKWSLAVKTPHGPMTMTLELKLDGKKVTGFLGAEQFGRLPLSGEYADAKLTFAVSTANGDLAFVGKLKDKDTLIGDFTGHAGDMPCTGTRVKEKK